MAIREGFTKTLATVLLSTAMAACTAVAQQSPATGKSGMPARTSSGELAKPTVAIENVCAWPNLTMLDDGTILATIYNKPSHGLMLGDIEVWGSTDQGKTWNKQGAPTVHEPGEPNTRMNHAVGLASNGDLIVIGGGWSLAYKDPDNKDKGYNRVARLRPWVSRSSDNGRTWQVDKEGFPANAPDGGILHGFGDIVRGQDGDLRVAAYTYHYELKKAMGTYVLRSKDDGRTWGDPVLIDPDKETDETFLIHLGEGRWLAAVRSGRLFLYRSDDDAKHWELVGPLTEDKEVPADLLKLKDGRLLFCYGRRVEGDEYVAARISEDDGQTWSNPVRLAEFIGWDGGYPSTVQLADGSLLTAFYARKTTYQNGHHMGVVRWGADKSFEH